MGASAAPRPRAARAAIAPRSSNGRASAVRIPSPFQYWTGKLSRVRAEGRNVGSSRFANRPGNRRLESATAATATSPVASPSIHRVSVPRLPVSTATRNTPR